MQEFVERIREALRTQAGVAPEDARIESPRDAALGDLAFPCFPLAKKRGKPPPEIAREIAGALAVDEVSAAAAGPYVNFTIARPALARAVLGRVLAEGERFGASHEGEGKTIVLDYSSPNIAKPMHVGHIRSTILGAALQRIFDFLGYRTVGINHVGDLGAQFGGLVEAIRRWGDEVDLERDPVRGLLELYQRSKKAADEDPQFAAKAVATNLILQRVVPAGPEDDSIATNDWVRDVSMQAFQKTYERLGIRHDYVWGENFYESHLKGTIERLEKAGITEISQGALIVDLAPVDKGLAKTPCLLKQSNGATLYATRDLAALFHRWEKFRFERCLYVVGSEQKLHFRQLKAVLKRMGVDWESRVEHVDFGLLLGPGRVKLASRKGEVLVLDDLIDEVVEEALAAIEAKNPELPGKDQVSEAVGIGAIVFNDLKRERVKDVVFDKREILSFEGETGPYAQYTHARLASILRKAGDAPQAGPIDHALLADAAPILLLLGRFPDALRNAARRAEPSDVSRHVLDLCQEMNAWYVGHRVLVDEPAVRDARLALVRGAKIAIGNGLRLLGVRAPDEM
jgi:arginyl-tRNA synthetase